MASEGHRTSPLVGTSSTHTVRRPQSTCRTNQPRPARTSGLRSRSPIRGNAIGDTKPMSRVPATTRSSRSATKDDSRSRKCRPPNSFSARGPIMSRPESSTRNSSARRCARTDSPSAITGRSPHHSRHREAAIEPSCNARRGAAGRPDGVDAVAPRRPRRTRVPTAAGPRLPGAIRRGRRPGTACSCSYRAAGRYGPAAGGRPPPCAAHRSGSPGRGRRCRRRAPTSRWRR